MNGTCEVCGAESAECARCAECGRTICEPCLKALGEGCLKKGGGVTDWTKVIGVAEADVGQVLNAKGPCRFTGKFYCAPCFEARAARGAARLVRRCAPGKDA